MNENKRKRVCPPSPRRVPTKGFVTPEQRLPESPPLVDPSRGLMSIVAGGFRDAVDRLFGSHPIVLNSPCSAHVTNSCGASAVSKDSVITRFVRKATVSNKCSSDSTSGNATPGSSIDTTEHFMGAVRFSADDDDDDDGSVYMPSAKRVRMTKLPEDNDQVVPGPRTPVTHVCNDSQCVCANSLWTANGVGPEVMLRTAEELSDRTAHMYAHAVNVLTNEVDYAALSRSADFRQYLVSARKLRYFDPLLLSVIERKAFFLNVYNSLMIHAITVLSKPRTTYDRISLYNSAAYNIGGRPYTLNMIEHGILRANRRGGMPFAQIPFVEADARRLCSLPDVDPRIHFALNCGARSCPPVRFYESHNLDKSLDSAARAYLQDVLVDIPSRTVTLPKLLQWYRVDFQGHNGAEDVLHWTLPYLTADKRHPIEKFIEEREKSSCPFKIVFASYDWTVNDSSE